MVAILAIFIGLGPWAALALLVLILFLKPIIMRWMKSRTQVTVLRGRTRWYTKCGYTKRDAVEMARADSRSSRDA
jgi:hypothetical protein